MKKTLLLCCAIFVCMTGYGQLFSDDFESYTDGDLIAATNSQWETWNNSPGSATDAPVSSAQAFSGNNSLLMEATSAAGGPADIILPFGQKFDSGKFTFEMQMYIPDGRPAYFNFQGEVAVAQTWSLQYFFNADGTVDFLGDGNASLGLDNLTYPQGEWFPVRVVANMTFNEWEVFVNGVSGGTFSNPDNFLASLNLYPTDPNGSAVSQYYVDDVTFDHEEVTLLDLDATLQGISVKPGALTGREIEVSGNIKNVGQNTINEMAIVWSDGTNDYMDNLTGLNIASLDEYTFTHSVPYTVVEGAQALSMTIESVNGGNDNNLDNNDASADVTGYTAAPGRKVLVEEGTGTWCGWCPRGEVILELMNGEYPDHFVSVAVHQGDPMEVDNYPGGLGFNAYPTMSIGREEVFGFGVLADVESRFFQRIVEEPVAQVNATAALFNSTLTLTAHANFNSAASGDYRMAMVLVENEVTGTGAGYNQVNFYAGGGAGPMAGYENLPNPVPASQMVYDHVGRVILGGVNGEMNSLPASIASGDSHEYTFDAFDLSSEWDAQNLKVVTILLNPDGSVNNVEEESLADIIEASDVNDVFAATAVDIYPNPFQGEAFIEIDVETPQAVSVSVFNAIGQQVAYRDYGQLNGNQVLPFVNREMENGFYFFQVQIGETTTTEKVLLSK